MRHPVVFCYLQAKLRAEPELEAEQASSSTAPPAELELKGSDERKQVNFRIGVWDPLDFEVFWQRGFSDLGASCPKRNEIQGLSGPIGRFIGVPCLARSLGEDASDADADAELARETGPS